MSAQNTVATVVREHAATYAGRPALVFAGDPASESGDLTLTYGELDLSARRLARWLRARVPAGGRALLLYPPGLAFGVAFVGCLYAGVIAVPVPMPSAGVRQREERAGGIARDAGVAIVLTEAASLATVTAWRDASGLAHLPCAATDAIDDRDEEHDAPWAVALADPSAPMMLQYTSGSTSEPKGVMISHDNVLAQVGMTRRVMAVGDHTRFGGWLPMHHDMGMVVQLLQPLVLGATSVFMSPFEFLKRPVRWLQLLDRHRVDVSLAPHFAYEICARHVSAAQAAALDLSGWSVAGIGAEVVRAQTLAAFAERFAPSGFRPQALTIGYGMAETTVYASVGVRGQLTNVRAVDSELLERNEFRLVPDAAAPGTRQVVSCGFPCETEIRIVDPVTRAPLPEGRVGEVWLRGPCVAGGYWEAEAATAATFRATLVTGEGGFLRTGDLGTLYDGELYITGRLKDLLIVHGRNLHPQDLEYEVRCLHPALDHRHGAVFAVADESHAERVVIVHECAGNLAGDRAGLAEIAALVREWSIRQAGFHTAGVVLLRPGGVSRTASGKVQRGLMRERFVNGELDALYEDLDPELDRRYRKDPVGGRRPAVTRGAA